MASQIHGAEYPIQKIFCDDFVFSIPRYQRPYAWETEQAEALLDDLLSFLGESEAPVDQLNPYFLGSIVLIKPEGKAEAEVVDGQQRLTTLTILLSVLREVVSREVANEITTYLYEKGSRIRNTENRYRLTLRERDAEFFHSFIQNEGGIELLIDLQNVQLSDSQTNIRDNALCLLQHLQALTELQCERLTQFLITGCLLVVVSTPDFEAAYRIFSVLNDRGLDLSPTDILKSEIIGKIPDAQQDLYNEKWEDQEETLGRDTFRELFSHIRMIYRKAKPKDSILKEFRQYVNPTQEPIRFIDQVLCPKAQAYADIRQCCYESHQQAEAINSYFKHLNKIDNVDWLPPAIQYLSLHRNQPEQLLQFFKALDRLASGLMIRRAYINERNQRYGQLLAEIDAGQDLFRPDSSLNLRDDECQAISDRLNGPLYLDRKIRLYVLLRLDTALAQSPANYALPRITVEHVLPQNPAEGSEWLNWFPDEETRLAYVHRLGNLALLSRSKNSSAQNYEFETKKSKYFSGKNGVSIFALTVQVLKEKTWTPAIVDERQQKLLKTLHELWDLPITTTVGG